MDYRRILYPWNYFKRRIVAIIVLVVTTVFMLFFKIPNNVIFSRDYVIVNLGGFEFTSGIVMGFFTLWVALWIFRGNRWGI